jgi:feruloyl-CoA synthase
MTTPVRAVALGPYAATASRAEDGSWLLRNTDPLLEFPRRYTESLVRWAQERPQATFLAQRDERGEWRRLSYAAALQRVQALGISLVERGLDRERPLMILSGNTIEHALLMLAALHVGVPVAPVSPAYSLLSPDAAGVRHAVDLLTPGLVFADNGAAFARAVKLAVPVDTEVVLASGELTDRAYTTFAQLQSDAGTSKAPESRARAARAHAAIDGDTIAKFLFTSGSTQRPKAVVNTHRMLCCNQQMLSQCYPFFGEQAPVLVDWMPWHHTAGGNNNFGLVLTHGGTLFIDEGTPTDKGMAATLRNLREISPTAYYTVPKGLDLLAREMRRDAVLRESFFSRLRLIFPAGAGLPQAVKDQVDAMALETTGTRIAMTMGLGMTETSPCALSAHLLEWASGLIGLPVPGAEVRLAPCGGKMEVRYRGPHVTPGYWRQPELSEQAFDADGFFCSGDAARFVDDAAPERGLRYDGRIAEDFKLSSGTWVNVAALRASLLSAGAPHVQDVVLTGHDRDEVGALLFLWPQVRSLAPTLPETATMADVVVEPDVRAWTARLLRTLASGKGSSQRIARAVLQVDPPSIADGEVTDKGSLNQRAVLRRRSELVDVLHAHPHDARVIHAMSEPGFPAPREAEADGK